MRNHLIISTALLSCGLLIATSTLASVKRVRVINKTHHTLFIHKGGFSPSIQLEPGRWKIFPYPFLTTPPGNEKQKKSHFLVATTGGRWTTTPNGYTYLHKPKLITCIDYASKKNSNKSGNRIWTIEHAQGIQKGCEIKGYRQTWYQNKA